MSDKKNVTFEYLPIAVLYENVYKNGEKKVQMRIGKWAISGVIAAPFIEKREFYKGPDGDWRQGKRQGFNEEDFKIMLEKKDMILSSLTKVVNPSKRFPASPKPEPQQEPNFDQPPF